MLRILVLVISICLVNVITATDKEESKDSWIESDAWSLDYSKTKNQPDSDPTTIELESQSHLDQHDVIYVYYRKLLALLCHKSKLMHDEASNSYKRTLSIQVSADDLYVLESSIAINPRDLDEIAARILSNAINYEDIPQVNFLKKIVSQFLRFLNKSEVLFVLLVLLFVIIIYMVHKFYNYKMITIVVLAMLIFGYFYTYFECNQKLDLEALMENFDDPNSNPCVSQKSFFSYWNTAPSKQMCFEHLKKKRTTFMFCRPDDVFIIYINDLILKQFQFMVDKCMEVCEKYSRKFVFPYNYIAMIAIPFLLVIFLKEIFKNILNPRNWRRGYSRSFEAKPTENKYVASSKNRDSLSGDNLKLLLNVLQNPPNLKDVGGSETKINSGVESLDCLTAPIKDKDTKFFESNTSIKDNKFFELNEQNASNSSSRSDLTDSSIEVIENC